MPLQLFWLAYIPWGGLSSRLEFSQMWTLLQQSTPQAVDKVAPLLFFAFAGLTVLSAWAIVLSQNIIRMSTYLLLTLGGAAGLYFMLQAELLAAIQLIVYAGGTLILIVFGVMLTSKNPFMQLRVKPWEMGLGIAIGLLILGLLVLAFVNTPGLVGHAQQTASYSQVQTIGKALLTRFLVPFEVAAVLLLIVMIGAAFMARRRTGE